MKTFRGILLKITFPLVLIIGLLVVQANCDLALPSYTSDIVNVGVTQGGITSYVPEIIRASEMDDILIFTDQDDKILEYYSLVSSDNKDELYDKYIDDYPIIDEEDIYVLTDTLSSSEEDELTDLMKMPILVKYALSEDLSSLYSSSDSDTSSSEFSDMLSQLPEGTTIMDVIPSLPEETVSQITSSVKEKFADLEDTITNQIVISYIRAEYEAVGMDTSSIQTNYVVGVGAKMLGIALIAMLAVILVTLLGARMGTLVAKDLRREVFAKVLKFSGRELNEFSTASLITRSTNDIQQVQTFFVMMSRLIIYAPILGIGAVIKVMNTQTDMAWVIGVAVCAMLVLVMGLLTIAMPKFRLVQKLVDRVNLVSREILTGLPVIRAFNTEKYEENRFDEANKDLTRVNLFVNRIMMIMMPTMMFIMNGVSILIIWVGADYVDQGTMQVGNLMAFIQYTMQIIMAFLMLSFMSIILPRSIVSLKRIVEILNVEPSINDPEEEKKFLESKKGVVEFKNVSFRYPKAKENVLSDISFTARPGETTAIIGSTGSGKSTLVNLIPRLYEVSEGEVLVNGQNIKNIKQKTLRSLIGYIPQKAFLFSGTIRSNIGYGVDKELSDKDLEKATEIAQAKEFVDQKPDHFDEPIAQNGDNVSGGQRQRLSIARAIQKQSDIFVFDDSFSALDFKTDRELRKSLKKELADATLIIVAQRISTVMNAEQIIVLEEGKVVGQGTHSELLNQCEVYKDIAYSQLSEDELNQKGGEQ